MIMTRAIILGAAVALVPVALVAATPSQTSHTSSGSSTGHSGTSTARSAPSGASLGGAAAIPGLCMLSRNEVLSKAKVALAADVRLKQLNQQVQTELTPEQTSINTDAKALAAQQATLSPADFQKRQAALQARLNALQQTAQIRQQELAATKQKALSRISLDAQPIINQAYRSHDCSVLLDRDAVLLGNTGNDITADVTRGLDAKVTTITFERERATQ
jgi:Skp family chaperone for outer membrane proteins